MKFIKITKFWLTTSWIASLFFFFVLIGMSNSYKKYRPFRMKSIRITNDVDVLSRQMYFYFIISSYLPSYHGSVYLTSIGNICYQGIWLIIHSGRQCPPVLFNYDCFSFCCHVPLGKFDGNVNKLCPLKWTQILPTCKFSLIAIHFSHKTNKIPHCNNLFKFFFL